MLQQIREKTAGIVVRVLFLVLVASFAIWGIGDPRWLHRGDEPPVKIAGEPVTLERIRQEYQRDLERPRRAFGGEVDPGLARQLGLVNQTVDRMVGRLVLERAAGDLGLVIDDRLVRGHIAREPAFQVGGQFDRNQFQRVLAEQQLTEPRYVQMVRTELGRGAIVDGVTLGAGAPPALTDVLFRYRAERRSGARVAVDAAAMPAPAPPPESELRARYERDLARYTEPELRALTVVRVGREEILPSIQPDEEKLKAEYAERVREFTVAEKRRIELIRFPDEAAAGAAKAKIDGGADFLAVAQEAGQDADAVRFGVVAKSDLPAELGAPLFAAAKDAVAGPIVTPIGIFVARTTEIEAGREPTFAELRDRLAKEMADRLAGDAAYRAANRLEDLVNGGKPLAEAAREIGVAAVAVPAADLRGNDREGKPVAVLAGVPEALAAAFATQPGRDTGLVEARSGAFVIARVDGVTPPQAKPFDQVKDDVLAQRTEEAREAAARARAEEIVRKVEGGATLEAAAEGFGLKAEPVPETQRDGRGATDATRVAQPTAQALFQLRVGAVGLAPGGGGTSVVRLDAIIPADPAQQADAVKQLSDQLAQQIANEMASEFTQSLRRRYGVTVDPAIADRLAAN